MEARDCESTYEVFRDMLKDHLDEWARHSPPGTEELVVDEDPSGDT